MTHDQRRSAAGRSGYAAPKLIRYRIPPDQIKEYQTATGAVNSIKCTDRDLCAGGPGEPGEGASIPQWLEP